MKKGFTGSLLFPVKSMHLGVTIRRKTLCTYSSTSLCPPSLLRIRNQNGLLRLFRRFV